MLGAGTWAWQEGVRHRSRWPSAGLREKGHQQRTRGEACVLELAGMMGTLWEMPMEAVCGSFRRLPGAEVRKSVAGWPPTVGPAGIPSFDFQHVQMRRAVASKCMNAAASFSSSWIFVQLSFTYSDAQRFWARPVVVDVSVVSHPPPQHDVSTSFGTPSLSAISAVPSGPAHLWPALSEDLPMLGIFQMWDHTAGGIL